MTASFKISKYDPNDYTLGEVLFSPASTTTIDKNQIESALSLYFQWPSHRMAMIRLASEPRPVPVELSCDQDESEISFVTATTQKNEFESILQSGQTIFVRFEIFRTCFEIETTILEVGSSDDQNQTLVLGLTEKGRTNHHRQLCRFEVAEGALGSLKFTKESGQSQNCHALSITSASIFVTGLETEVYEVGRLHIENQAWDVEVVRVFEQQVALKFLFRTDKERGDFFEVYRRIAYPSLRPRGLHEGLAVLKVYEDTGYLGRYVNHSEEASTREEILKTWETLEEGTHKVVVDYVAEDAQGKVVGCSGLALSHFKDGIPVWFFNQLCSVASPELMEQTAALYQWRLDYLMAMSDDLFVCARYRSQSRWLERIFTKFANNVTPAPDFFPVLSYQKIFSCSTNPRIEVSTLQAGKSLRYHLQKNSVWGALMPAKFNISDALDAVFAFETVSDAESVEEVAGALLHAAGVESMAVSAAIHPDAVPPTGAYIGKSDRLLTCPKNQLVDLASHMEHVVAVTKRKFGV